MRVRASLLNAFALAALLCGNAATAQTVSWLYDVGVEIPDRSAQARSAATRTALATVLVRLTGLATVPDSAVVSAALAAPERYAIQFGYDEKKTPGHSVSLLQVRFSDAAVLRLIGEAGLPLWSANRPTLMVWAVAEEAGERRILAAPGDHPLTEGLLARANFRGLPVTLPTMDLEDELNVSAGAVWGGIAPVLREASTRYGADGMLIVRADQTPSREWHTAWRLVALDGEQTFEMVTPTLEQAAAAAVDRAADVFVARYAIPAGVKAELHFRIDGVSDVAQYAAVLAYLGSLEFVDNVRVDQVERHVLRVSVLAHAAWERFRDLLDLDARLVATPEVVTGADEIALLWQGTPRS